MRWMGLVARAAYLSMLLVSPATAAPTTMDLKLDAISAASCISTSLTLASTGRLNRRTAERLSAEFQPLSIFFENEIQAEAKSRNVTRETVYWEKVKPGQAISNQKLKTIFDQPDKQAQKSGLDEYLATCRALAGTVPVTK